MTLLVEKGPARAEMRCVLGVTARRRAAGSTYYQRSLCVQRPYRYSQTQSHVEVLRADETIYHQTFGEGTVIDLRSKHSHLRLRFPCASTAVKLTVGRSCIGILTSVYTKAGSTTHQRRYLLGADRVTYSDQRSPSGISAERYLF